MSEGPQTPSPLSPWLLDLGFQLSDRIRRAQGTWMDMMGHGPVESAWHEIARIPGMRLRAYEPALGATFGPPLLIVPAPIKRHYIWDLDPPTSVVARLCEAGFAVYMIEWLDEDAARGGLEDFASRLILAACDAIAERHASLPVLLGHSLGGTLAAIFAALRPDRVAALVLVEAPLCFAPGSGVFDDLLKKDAGAPERMAATSNRVPGSVLDAASMTASPATFVEEPWRDMMAVRGDAAARATHMRVRRWALDEFAMPARLFGDVVGGLYRDDLFAAQRLAIDGHHIGPAQMSCPILAVLDPRSALLPIAAVKPALDKAPGRSRIIEHGGEVGVVFQHVGALVGRRAHQSLWPEIISWIRNETAVPARAVASRRPPLARKPSRGATSSRPRRSSR